MTFKIVRTGTLYYASGDTIGEHADALLKHGWKWLKTKSQWVATHPRKVYPFIDYCDDLAQTAVSAWMDLQLEIEEKLAESAAGTADIIVKSPDGKVYRPYQLAGIAYMRDRHSSLNADVPRLGKTIQALGVVNNYDKPLRVLVVCPAIAKTNWCREATLWLMHPTTIGKAMGSKLPATDFLVINWEILSKHVDVLKKQHWDVVVFDEAHMMKNPKSQRGKAAKKLDGTLHTLYLTGTPIYTRPIDLWPLLQRCDPSGIGSNWKSFVFTYCDAKHDGFGLDTSGASNEEDLQLKLRSRFMIRREKKDVGRQLPSTKQNVFLPKEGLQALLAEERTTMEQNLIDLVESLDLAHAADDVVAELANKLLDPSHLFGPSSTVRRKIAEAKIPMVVEFLQEILLTDPKIVVFAHHRAVTEGLYEALAEFNPVLVNGGVTAKARDAALAKFDSDPSCRVFVGNIQSAGSAISLAAADTMVFAEISWIPTDMDQAEERIWNPVKQNPLSYFYLTVKGTMESAMAVVLEKRRISNDKALNYEHLPPSIMS